MTIAANVTRQTSTASASNALFFRSAIISLQPSASERLQVLQQRPLFFRRQTGAVIRAFVAGVTIPFFCRIKDKEFVSALFGDSGNKSDILGIVHVVTSIEELAACGDGLQQLAEMRHRSIV